MFLGLVDVGFAVMLGLGMSSLYQFVRFRAALGLGLTGFIFYAQGQPMQLIAVAAGSAGLYLCTVFVNLIPAIIAALAGVGGMGYFAWLMIAT